METNPLRRFAITVLLFSLGAIPISAQASDSLLDNALNNLKMSALRTVTDKVQRTVQDGIEKAFTPAKKTETQPQPAQPPAKSPVTPPPSVGAAGVVGATSAITGGQLLHGAEGAAVVLGAKRVLKGSLFLGTAAAAGYAAVKLTHDGRMELTADEQGKLEQTKLWKKTFIEVESLAAAQDKKLRPRCSVANIRLLGEKPTVFRTTIGQSLPSLVSTPYAIGNVGSYESSRKKKTDPESDKDHIPSKASIIAFTKIHGISINNKNLIKNTSTIAIPRFLHRRGRTFGDRGEAFYQNDARDLRLATVKDMATLISMDVLENKGRFVKKLISGFIVLYARNKLLCLYQKNL